MSDCLSNCNLPGSSVRGLSRQEHWSGLPFPSPGGLPDPGTEPASLASPALAGGFFTISCISCVGRWILYHLLHLLHWQVDSLPSLASPALAGGFFTISCISCVGRWILYHEPPAESLFYWQSRRILHPAPQVLAYSRSSR